MHAATRLLRRGASLLAVTTLACRPDRVAAPIDAIDVVTTITLSPDSATIPNGGSLQLTATATGATGIPFNGITPTWSVADTSIASVESTGRVVGKRGGVTQVVATIGTVSGRATVRVLFPTADSGVVRTNEALVLRVGLGSVVQIPPGALPAGARVNATDAAQPQLVGADTVFTVSVRGLAQATARVSATPASQAGASGQDLLVQIVRPGSLEDLLSRGRAVVSFTGLDGSPLAAVFPDSVVERGDGVGGRQITVSTRVPTDFLGNWTSTASAGVRAAVGTVPHFCSGTGGATLTSVRSDPSTQRIPVILIHGLQPTQLSCLAVENYEPATQTWDDVLARLDTRRADFDPYVFKYPSFQSLARSVEDLDSLIQEKLPGRDIIIIAHSNGGLIAGKYMHAVPSQRVGHLLALGTPWLGLELANDITASFRELLRCTANTENTLTALSSVADLGIWTWWRSPSTDGLADLRPSSSFFATFTSNAVQSLDDRLTVYNGDVRASFHSIPVVKRFWMSTMPCVLSSLGAASAGDGIASTESATNNGRLTHVNTSLGFDHVLLRYDDVDNGMPTPFDPLPKVRNQLDLLRPQFIPVATVRVSASRTTLPVGATMTVTASLQDYLSRAVTNRSVVWTASPTGVVSLNSATGTVTALAAGTATITATVTAMPSGGGGFKTDQVTVVVASPTTGSVGVNTATSGSSQDPDGYTATVAGQSQSVGINSAVTFTNVAAGQQAVVLSGVASNCTVSGGTSKIVTVPAGGSVPASFNITCAATPTTIDLTVSALNAPETATIGGSAQVSATVTNQGSANAGAFRVGFYFSTNATITTADVFSGNPICTPSGLAAGATYTCSTPIAVPSSLSPGTYYIGAIADDLGAVNESDESNNARAAGPVALSGPPTATPTAIASDLLNAHNIAIAGGVVYWVENNSSTGRLRSVSVNGGRITTLASGLSEPSAIGVDQTHVYWIERGGSTTSSALKRIPKAGGNIEVLASGLRNSQNRLALDGAAVYFGEGVQGGGATIVRVPKAGGPKTTIASGILNLETAVATDGTNVYYSDGRNSVMRVPVSGGNPSVVANGEPEAIVILGSTLYWVEFSDAIVRKVSVAGGAVTTLASGPGNGGGIATDGAWVYWITSQGVFRVPASGGAMISISSEGNTIGIGLDASNVYWATDPTILRNGQILKLPK